MYIKYLNFYKKINCSSNKDNFIDAGSFKKTFTLQKDPNKVLITSKITNKNDLDNWIKEFKLQTQFGNPIEQYGVCNEQENQLYKIENKAVSLYNYNLLLIKENINKKFLIEYFISLSKEIKKLHQKNYGHFDIKLENILVKYNLPDITNITTIILTDFGFSSEVDINGWKLEKGLVGSFPMVDLNRDKFDYQHFKADIYALGFILVYFFSESVFSELFDIHQEYYNLPNLDRYHAKIYSRKYHQEIVNLFNNAQDVNPLLKDLYLNMFQLSIERRYSIDEVIRELTIIKNIIF